MNVKMISPDGKTKAAFHVTDVEARIKAGWTKESEPKKKPVKDSK